MTIIGGMIKYGGMTKKGMIKYGEMIIIGGNDKKREWQKRGNDKVEE